MKGDGEAVLATMLAAIAHRGPDGNGYYLANNVALGHQRLAIIDVENGAQPMIAQDGKTVISFNGEIYNYKQLRSELVAQGFTFRTHSDTEVILHLYRKLGLAAFTKLRGMYALALWDHDNQRGFLARDPLGIKPIFYSIRDSGELVFASEAKAVFCQGVDCALDESSLHLLMNFRYVPGSKSLFKTVSQLPPGSVLEWCEGAIRNHRFDHAADESQDSILDSIDDSVGAHLTSDVEVASYLSGGIDSALITLLASKRTRLRTFTSEIGDDPSEARNAARSAVLFGVDNIVGRQLDAIENELPRLIWHLEVPKINAYQVAQLARHASKYVKVCLSGLGGDELFMGYNMHGLALHMRQMEKLVPKRLLESSARMLSNVLDIVDHRVWTEPKRFALMVEGSGNWPRIYGLLRNVWDDETMRKRVYGPRMLDSRLPDAYEYLEAIWPAGQDQPLEAIRRFEWQNKMVDDLLWQEDRCSMAEGLEVRVPLVDCRVRDACFSLSAAEMMIKGRKGLLKGEISKLLPGEILRREKSGFQVEARTFFEKNLTSLAARYLNSKTVEEYGVFNPDFVRAVRSYRGRKAVRWHYFMLYLMLLTHIWLDIFERRISYKSLTAV